VAVLSAQWGELETETSSLGFRADGRVGRRLFGRERRETVSLIVLRWAGGGVFGEGGQIEAGKIFGGERLQEVCDLLQSGPVRCLLSMGVVERS
jgi:hypothetical protein